MKAEAERQLAALRALHQVTTALHSSSDDLPATLHRIAEGVVATAGFGVCALNVRQPGDVFEVVTVAGEVEGLDAMLGSSGRLSTWLDLVDLSQQWGSRVRYLPGNVSLDESVIAWVPDRPAVSAEDAWDPEDALFVPLTTPEGDWLGVISVDLPEGGRRPQPWQIEVLEMFADSAAVAMMNTRLLDYTRHAALHDPLTGLPNRAHLNAWAAQRRHQDILVLVIDLDGFKAVNDTYGHQTGDEVLVAVAARMRQAVRDSDLLARTGGDEFVVLVSNGGEEAERLVRRRLEAVFVGGAGQGTLHEVGASIGAARGQGGFDLSALLSAADADMYRRKRRGGSPATAADPGLPR